MNERIASSKSADAYRTISEVAEDLGLPQHVLRFWETRFPQVKPLKRAGGRRFYRPEDVDLLRAVQALLYGDGYTIKGVQRMLRDQGAKAITALAATPPIVAPAAVAVVPSSGGRAEAEGSANLSRPDDEALPDREPALDRDGHVTRPSRDPETRPPLPVDADISHRLEAVLSDLAACERLIRSVRTPHST